MPRRTLTEPDARAWFDFAQRRGLTLEQLVREAVELAMARGSTR